ncbi:hypothetical protein [Acetobacter thailandicus]|uniref:Uncharacterized protein n=1 Tax=Acetobacter thailandicus TaxID=1502842 RepID=A0ABT3QDB6_9PROT|nr:hypothetical protein [Acetobacter thailandicus]MBS1003193.1 hypothetical protein [Acetobacter thailandicus]MCX2563292.1 hypothetical protein [Acetobacter thailandicus]NHN94046.1 hypothetical protein [Acetobacter thailandicus]
MCDTDPHSYDCADPNTLIGTPFLAHSLVDTAELWSFLHPFATLDERRKLLVQVAQLLGVDSIS